VHFAGAVSVCLGCASLRGNLVGLRSYQTNRWFVDFAPRLILIAKEFCIECAGSQTQVAILFLVSKFSSICTLLGSRTKIC
jgi:hypothetical protein